MGRNEELDAGPSRGRANDMEVQILHEIEILDRELAGTGTHNNYFFNNVLYRTKTVIRFNNFSPLENSIKRVLVVAPEQPQCRF